MQPSIPDIALTKQLVETGELINIAVLDHIIYTKDGGKSLSVARPELFARRAFASRESGAREPRPDTP